MRFRLSIAVLVGALWLSGCTSPSAPHASATTTATTGESAAEKRLADQARREATASSARSVAAASIQPPPGVEPGALTPRNADDPVAFLSLDEALSDVVRKNHDALSPMTEREPVDLDRRAEAVAHYAKARSVAMDGRVLQAVIELQKANELDPESAEVLRELARCYLAVNNSAQAMDTFEKLLRLEPDNEDALFAVAMTAAGQREFERAAFMLARWRTAGSASQPDSATRAIADFALAASLRELGYDRAFVAVGRQSIELPDSMLDEEAGTRLASVYRQRGETLRSIGDAHCRLGEMNEALRAYAESSALPTADPDAILPRLIYVNLLLRRPAAAQQELLSAIKKDDQAINDRTIRLCAYLREHAGTTESLAAAVEDLYRANPENGSLARAAATLLPHDRARDLLRDFVARQPRDLEGVSQLLLWLAEGDIKQSADLATALAAAHPDLADDFADRLAMTGRRGAVLQALRSLSPSPARSHMEARLLWTSGSLGEAWTVIEQARANWPDDRALAIQQLHLSATLQETALFEQVLATMPPMDDVPGMLALSQGHRAMGQVDEALSLAIKAAEREPQNADAVIELARAHLAKAASLAPDPDTRAEAVAALETAIATANIGCDLAPDRDDAYEVLALVSMPGGIRADSETFRALIQKLRQNHPESSLLARLAAQEDLAQRRSDRAVERLLALYDREPHDGAILALAVTAWQQARKLDEAHAWLQARLTQGNSTASSPALLEQWVRVCLSQDRADDAMARLTAIIEADPEDGTARRLLETVHRASGNFDAATALGERRLLAQPQGIRREIELAAMYAGATRPDAAVERLHWVRDHAAQASINELNAALQVTSQLEEDSPHRDDLTFQLVNQAIERFPNANLHVYGFGLRALARSNASNEAFDAMADRAAAHAKGANGATAPAAAMWRDLAQTLVDDGQPDHAARAVRARLRSNAPLEDPVRGLLTIIALVSDAAADAREHDPARVNRSMELLRSLDAQGKIGVIFREAERAALPEAVYEASSIYTLVGARTGANLLLREALQHNADLAMALNNLGYALLDADSDAESRRESQTMIERASELMPDDPNILDSLGWLRYKQGKFVDQPGGEGDQKDPLPGALSSIQKSITRALSPSPEVIDHRGDVQWRLGRQRDAIESWRQVIKMIEDEQYRSWVMDNLRTLQSSGWQLIVIDPRAMYDQEYGPIRDRARAKADAADAGEQPHVAPLFDESLIPNP